MTIFDQTVQVFNMDLRDYGRLGKGFDFTVFAINCVIFNKNNVQHS